MHMSNLEYFLKPNICTYLKIHLTILIQVNSIDIASYSTYLYVLQFVLSCSGVQYFTT